MKLWANEVPRNECAGVLTHVCTPGHWERHMAGSSMEWEHWSPAALCPSLKFPVPAVSAAQCATEVRNTQVTLLLPRCSDRLLEKPVKAVGCVDYETCTFQLKQVTVIWSRMDCDEIHNIKLLSCLCLMGEIREITW